MTLPRLYPILDTATLSARGCPAETAAEAILAGGARILQFRHKGHFSRDVFKQAESVAGMCHREGAIFIIDDRADVAMLLGAGVHAGQDDLAPADARRLLGEGPIVGFSTHNEQQLRDAAAEPVDYVALGPVFGTVSKARPDPTVGIEELRRLRPLATRPFVAIGGITRENARSVLDAGADSVAVIADLFPESCTFDSLRARVEQWQQILKA